MHRNWLDRICIYLHPSASADLLPLISPRASAHPSLFGALPLARYHHMTFFPLFLYTLLHLSTSIHQINYSNCCKHFSLTFPELCPNPDSMFIINWQMFSSFALSFLEHNSHNKFYIKSLLLHQFNFLQVHNTCKKSSMHNMIPT